MAAKKRVWIIATAWALCVILIAAGTAYFALSWIIQRSYYELHAPGTYYFVTFDGPWQPFRPRHEISQNEALLRSTYCVGTFDADGWLIRLERYLDGSLFFRFDYSYHPSGKLREVHDWQRDGPVRAPQSQDRPI